MYRLLLNQKTWLRRFSSAQAHPTQPPLAAVGCAFAAATAFAWGGRCISAEETGEAISLPVDLLIVRHGQSEANMMICMKKLGDMSGQAAMDEVSRHDSMMRLTDLGREQARTVGRWVNENVGRLDKFYVSEYVRTKETAAMMGLPNATWKTDMMIRERDQGVQDGQGDVGMGLSDEEQHRKLKSPMYWQPMAGESMSDVCIRVRHFLHRLQTNATGMRCVVVCHYRTIHAFRFLLENIPQDEFPEVLGQEMPNCCIWWYSRRDANGKVGSVIASIKRIAVQPDGSAEVVDIPLSKGTFSNDELLAECLKVPQVLNNASSQDPAKGRVVKKP